MRNFDHAAVWEADRDHFIHPYADFAHFKAEGSQIITEAHGIHILDSTGRKYLDGIAGLWCVNVGHGREEIANAVSSQIMKMQYYNPFGHSTNVPAAILARELASLTPDTLNHVFYSTGGSTANDAAIRIVHYYFNQLGKPNKKKIISRIDGYHGATYVAANLTGIHATKIGFDAIGRDFIHHVSAADMYRGGDGRSEEEYCDFLADEFERRILQLDPDNVAAFIAEPIMGAGGVLIAPQGYHSRMYQICKKYGMLYIADEVVTAFGRLGEWVSSEALFGHVPDILILAKGITSGYVPLGATILSDAVHDVISQPQCADGVFTMGFTYSGHPVACAAALETIDIMKRENMLDHVRNVGPHLQAYAKKLLRHEIVGDVRGSHLMLGIDLVSNRQSKEGFPASSHAADVVFARCKENGVIIRPIGNRIVVSPPLILSKTDCETIVDVLDDAISAATHTLQN
ncbi:aminotransferase [Agrobacterium rhizogenes]|uniref:aminotransferase n=1 Tax=Rhizobium rhizogenes TaxID=359 RepID=UPI0015716AD3|nr:aminotransferase [Rhizobium rhizogenes]NTG51703.1 aminotransferase [Rhizobium rhizogenes]